MSKYQRAAIEAVQYTEPKGDLLEFERAEEATRAVERAKAFDKDAGIAALKKFVKGAKGASGKKADLAKTAGWGRDSWQIGVDTPDGTMFLSPGDWLIRDGNSVRVVREAAFADQFKASS